MSRQSSNHAEQISDAAWPGVSYYQAELRHEHLHCPSAKGQQQHQVMIIGAGLAGLSTAWSLVEHGITDIGLYESRQPGHGASGRNGGFVFAGYSLPNHVLARQAGTEQGRLLHQWTQQAVGLVKQRSEQLNIDCQINTSGVLLADWFRDDHQLKRFQHNMQDKVGFALEWIDRKKTREWIQSDRYGSSLYEPGSFHFNPLRYINGLVGALQKAGVSLYGDSPIETLKPALRPTGRKTSSWHARTPEARVQADQVIITTGGYDTHLWPKLSRAIQPIATYIATTVPLGDQIHQLMPKHHAVYDTRFAFDYYRPLPDTRLLWGGRISIKARSPDQIRDALRRDLVKVFPELAKTAFDHAWGGWMGYTRHKMPLLGQDSMGLWHATGFGGHGMAPTTMTGEVIAEAMTGNPTRLNAFKQWQPVWAGGTMGRVWAQATYWALNFQDAWRDRRATRRGQHA